GWAAAIRRRAIRKDAAVSGQRTFGRTESIGALHALGGIGTIDVMRTIGVVRSIDVIRSVRPFVSIGLIVWIGSILRRAFGRRWFGALSGRRAIRRRRLVHGAAGWRFDCAGARGDSRDANEQNRASQTRSLVRAGLAPPSSFHSRGLTDRPSEASTKPTASGFNRAGVQVRHAAMTGWQCRTPDVHGIRPATDSVAEK